MITLLGRLAALAHPLLAEALVAQELGVHLRGVEGRGRECVGTRAVYARAERHVGLKGGWEEEEKGNKNSNRRYGGYLLVND